LPPCTSSAATADRSTLRSGRGASPAVAFQEQRRGSGLDRLARWRGRRPGRPGWLDDDERPV